jgi:hypothetical protein
LRFGEALAIGTAMGDQALLAVYHHRGQGQSWATVLSRLWNDLPRQFGARAIFGGDVALMLIGSPATLAAVDDPMNRYIADHRSLRVSVDGTANDHGLESAKPDLQSVFKKPGGATTGPRPREMLRRGNGR